MERYRKAETSRQGSHNHDRFHHSGDHGTHRISEREIERYHVREYQRTSISKSPTHYKHKVTRIREYYPAHTSSSGTVEPSTAQKVWRNVDDLSRNLDRLSMETKRRNKDDARFEALE